MLSSRSAVTRDALAAAALLVAGCWPAARGEVPEAVPEYDLKATYIIKIATTYVRWPEATLMNSHGVLTLCIFGRDDFGSGIDRLAAEQRKIFGQTIDVERLPAVGPEAAGCHVAFIGRSEQDNLAAVLATLSKLPVLTFSDIEGFAAQGGMIELVLIDRNIRFKIDPGASKRAGLEMKAQLLTSAIELTSVKP